MVAESHALDLPVLLAQVADQTQDILNFTIAQQMGVLEVTTVLVPGSVQCIWNVSILMSVIASAMTMRITARRRVDTGKQE